MTLILSFCFSISCEASGQYRAGGKYAPMVLHLDSLMKTIKKLDSAASIRSLSALNAEAASTKDLQYMLAVQLLGIQYYTDRGILNPETEREILGILSKTSGDDWRYLRADAFQTASNYYWLGKKYSLALENSMYAHAIYSGLAIEEFPRKHQYLQEFGARYYYFNDYATAKKYFLEFLRSLPPGRIDKNISPVNTLALCYSHLQAYDSSVYYFNIAEEAAIRNGSEEWVGIIAGNKANVFFQQGKYDLALPLFEKDAEMSMKNKIMVSAILSYSSAGEIYRIKGNLKKALEYQEKAIAMIPAKIGKRNFAVRSRVFPYAAQTFAANGFMEKAYLYLDSGFAAKDSLVRQKNLLYIMGAHEKVEAVKHLAELEIKQAEVERQQLVRNGFIGGFAVMLLCAALFFVQRTRIGKEKRKTDDLLLNILPSEVAEELKRKGSAAARQYDEVTVMFTDFKDFTRISESLSPSELVTEIHNCFMAFDNIIGKYNIEKIKTIGDSYMCAGGLPAANNTHAEDVLRAAIEFQELMLHRKAEGKDLFEIRIGIHTGPVVAGIVGVMKFAYDIWGDTVNIASRMESAGEAGKINISGTTFEQIKHKFTCHYRGKVEAKNKGSIDMYFVEGQSAFSGT